jgi:3-dehydroquinate synthetase
MVDTTDIEKKSLEAHVELCAERYRMLELKIETVENEVSAVKHMVSEVHDIVRRMGEKRNDQLIAWGIGIIGVLLGVVGWLTAHYIKTL